MSSLIDLKGFPMVFSYTEAMLNNQIALHREDMFPSHFKVTQPEEEWEDDQEDPDWTFEVRKFDSPRITFDVPTLNNGAKLNIKILDGGFTYFTVEHRKVVQKTIDLSTNTLSIITPVKQRRHDDFTDANFQVESIYADLSQIESADILYDNHRQIKVNSTLAAGLDGIIKRGIKAWSEEYEKKNKGKLPMVFGGTRIPRVFEKHYRLKPSGCTYSVTQRRDRNNYYIDGALNMLLQIDGLELSNSPAAGAFDIPLPRSNLNEGVLVVSSYALSKKIIMPALMRQYDNRYVFEARHSSNDSNGDFILNKPVIDHKQKLLHRVQLKTKRIEGELVPGAYRLFIDVETKTPHWSGTITSTSESYMDLKFILDDDALKIEKSKPVTKLDHNESLLGRVLGDIVTGFLDEVLRHILECDASSELGKAVSGISADLKEAISSILVPGGQTGVFDYSSVEIKNEPNINGYPNMFLYAKFE